MELRQKESLLDRPLSNLLKPNGEKATYLALFVAAVASRFWNLGARAISFEECSPALYSYYLYNGTGWTHNPMMHGPFLFHANALIYFLFGDSDYMARIVPALFGVFVVMSPLLLRRWLGRAGTMVTSLLLLISPTILYYSRYIRNDIYITVWIMLLTAALFHFLEDHQPRWFYLGAAVLMLALATKENAYFFAFIGLAFLLEVWLWERVGRRARRWLFFGGALLSLMFLAAASLLGRTPPGGSTPLGNSGPAMKLLYALVTVAGGSLPVILVSASLIPSRPRGLGHVELAIRRLRWRQVAIAAVLMAVIYVLLFSGFFSSPEGLATGIFGSLSYWLSQQQVARGSQPWYYYFLLLAMYEFLPLLLGLVGMGAYVLRGPRAHADPEERGEAEALPSPETVPEAPSPNSRSLFVPFLILWTLVSLFLYGWAGEKMPWMVVHMTLPLVVLAAKFAGELIERVDWRAVWQRGGAALVLLLPITGWGLYTLASSQPSRNWLLVLFLTLVPALLAAWLALRLGARRVLVVAVTTSLALLAVFTVRFAWMASYINYDYATELLVYAHGGVDVKPLMDEIADISRRTTGEKTIEVAYDQEAAWPLEWYMRQYPNRKFYGRTPTREALDAPIVIASSEIDDRVRPILGNRYDRFRVRSLWWPDEEYKGLTWTRIWDILRSPSKRETLWNILYYRQYPRTPDDWYNVDNIYLYVRKDVAQQAWGYGAVPPEAYQLPPDPYTEAEIKLPSAQVWGQAGASPGQFNHPHALAVGPEGQVYIADSDNHRIQEISSDGVLLREWGSQCNLATSEGCVDPDGAGPLESGDGQFQEPWGVVVGSDGRVYVADTWNHRIQVFDANGAFLFKWGTGGQSDSAPGIFFGPRDLAVDPSGRVYIADTGNKRVQVFDVDGGFLTQWGGAGTEPGQFQEPTSLAVDSSGRVYVADTWNQRVQVFDGSGRFLRQWTVDAWYGESVANKPYLAVDQQDRVYITDPEGYRVAVFDRQGELLVTFGQYGSDANSFSLPTGIDVDAAGNVYISDTDGQRILKFQPVP